jgi:uncharacterized membrane protein
MTLNRTRILLGGLAGGFVWLIWSWAAGRFIIGTARYDAAQSAGLFLRIPRYHAFLAEWIVALIVMAIVLAYLYACARQTLGSGPKTALMIGFLVGFVAGFPLNFAQAAWSQIDRMFPLGWMLDIWVGCILATLVAGWVYKD